MVSVIIPLFRAKRFISKTLQSVLDQTYQDFEIVIVDDCGMDGTLEVAYEFQRNDSRIRIFENRENKGIAFSRNRAIAESRGEYIAILDDDDIMMNLRLEKQVCFLEANPDIGAVGGKAQWIDENDNILIDIMEFIDNPIEEKMFLCFRNNLNNSEMTFRKSVIEKYQIQYIDGMFGMEDFRFWIDFSKVSNIMCIDELVLQRRILKSSQTNIIRNNLMNARAKKFLELQIYSLRRSGFIISEDITKGIEKYMGETQYICSSFTEFSELVILFSELLIQAKCSCSDIYPFMETWFLGLSQMQLTNILDKRNSDKKRTELEILRGVYHKQNQYISELQEGKTYLEKHCEELEKYVLELQEGKTYLEKHCEELEKYILELQEGKTYLEKHCVEMENYIQELLDGKEWIESQWLALKEMVLKKDENIGGNI